MKKQEAFDALIFLTQSRAKKPLRGPQWLREHPFGLTTIPMWNEHEAPILFCGTDGGSSSIHDLAREVMKSLEGFGGDWDVLGQCFRLRIIKAEAFQDQPGKHSIYYECQIGASVYLCSGCTDFSGEGGQAHVTLGSAFRFLGNVCGVDIEEVIIPYPKNASKEYRHDEKLQQLLREAYEEERAHA